MKILTFSSQNAPPEKAWVAYWQVPVKEVLGKPMLGKAPPSKEGIMPYSFWGSTEEEAIAKAQEGWDTSFGKEEKRQRELSTVRTRKRA